MSRLASIACVNNNPMKEIQTTHNKAGVVSSDEYYTPHEIIDSLGEFDTDPCSPSNPHWRTAKKIFTKEDDGLQKPWEGRVWLNPPYSAPLFGEFMKRMAEHGNGIALVVPKFGTRIFREYVFPYCTGIYILRDRIKFFDQNWQQQRSPICQSVLIAYTQSDYDAILSSGLSGVMLCVKDIKK